MKQVCFLDKENNHYHGGILTDNGDIICGCCGGLIEKDEIGDGDEFGYKIVYEYGSWVDLDEAICGDDMNFEN